ncbi:MAG: hypothetical protein ABFD69_12400 [Candidatus Sumerlaeia bacterium]
MNRCVHRLLLVLFVCSSCIIHHSSFASDDLKDREIKLLRLRLDRAQNQLADARIKRLVFETQLQVAAMRSFLVKEPVEYAELTPAVLNWIVDDSVKKQYPGHRLDLYIWFNVLMGAMPDGIDLPRYLKDLMGEQAAGIYHPGTKKLYVSTNFDLERPLGRMVLAHEISHAMQDQDYDLRRMGVEDIENDDRALAALAVAEGDATLLMSEYVSRYGNPVTMMMDIPRMLLIDQSKFEQAPVAIQQIVLFPYLEGMKFFQALAGRTRQNPKAPADWTVGMDSAWRGSIFQDPPETTEQIIHPDKYLAREMPATIEPFKPSGKGAFGQNVFGEFGIRTLLEPSVGREQAVRAAAGWNGDRILLALDEAGDHAFSWTTKWDTEADAEEFAQAMAQAMEARVEGLKLSRDGNEWSGKTERDRVTIKMTKAEVVVEGTFGKPGKK